MYRWDPRIPCLFPPALAALAVLTVALITPVAGGPPLPLAGPVEILPAQDNGGGIFVPKPRGAGETLDDSPPEPEKPAHTVTTVEGDRLSGTVVEIDAAGRLRLTGPHYEGDVSVLTSHLNTVTLKQSEKESGSDRILLQNGDVVTGKLIAISGDEVVLQSTSVGTRNIDRRVVQSISLGKDIGRLLETDFRTGKMDPFATVQGNWNVGGGRLRLTTHGQMATVAAELKQSEAVTMVADLASIQNGVNLILFAGQKTHHYGQDSVMLQFQRYHCYLQVCQKGSVRNVKNLRHGRNIRKGVVRFAYDPETQKATVWLNDSLILDQKAGNAPKTGKYVMISSHYYTQIKSVRVLPGIVGPDASVQGGEEEANVVVFANKDRMRSSEVTFADGKFVVKTPFGVLPVPAEKIGGVYFRLDAMKKLPDRAGDVRVETDRSRLTARLVRLTDNYVELDSAYMGQFKMLRDAIKSIRFRLGK